jgi:hypothetical protein
VDLALIICANLMVAMYVYDYAEEKKLERIDANNHARSMRATKELKTALSELLNELDQGRDGSL